MPARLLQGALLTAAAGAIVVVADLLGTAGLLAGLGAIGFGTVLAAPAARGTEGGWWNGLAAGGALCAAGAAISPLSDTVGGLITVLGTVTVLVACALAFPTH